MATHTEHGTRCALCRRNLLVGEAARTYQDARNRGVQTVCPLCTERAERSGWTLVGERAARRPLPVDVDNRIDHERLVVRLQSDLARLERDLGGSLVELKDERSQRERLEVDLEAVRTELAAARAELATVATRIAEKDALITDAERRATESLEAQSMLLKARRREADPFYLCGIGAEVFSRSAHLAELHALAAEHGTPDIHVAVEGSTLPRIVRVSCAWPAGSRSYRVRCDLVARLFDVEDIGHGPGLQAPLAAFTPNARLEADRVVVLP